MWKRPTFLPAFALLLLFPITPTLLALSSQAPQERQQVAQEKMIDRTFSVGADGRLEVSVGDSDVEIVAGASGQVHVEVFLEGRNMDKAREYFERQRFNVTQSGNAVRVETDPKSNIQFHWGNWRDHPQILTRVTVPERFNADLKTSDGDVRVDRLRGDISLKTSDGDVQAGALYGANVMLKSSDGDLRVETIEGETVDLQTSDGDVQLGQVQATRLLARTSDGDLRAGRIDGEAELKTSDGDIHVDALHGATVTARTSDGDITIGELVARRSTVHSNDGRITLRRVEGALEASGSDANLEVELFKPDAVTLTTSDGNIVLLAPANLPADVRLRGDDVRISKAFDFRGRVEEESAEGSINGGGPLIEARTSDGSVTLRAQ